MLHKHTFSYGVDSLQMYKCAFSVSVEAGTLQWLSCSTGKCSIQYILGQALSLFSIFVKKYLLLTKSQNISEQHFSSHPLCSVFLLNKKENCIVS